MALDRLLVLQERGGKMFSFRNGCGLCERSCRSEYGACIARMLEMPDHAGDPGGNAGRGTGGQGEAWYGRRRGLHCDVLLEEEEVYAGNKGYLTNQGEGASVEKGGCRPREQR